jgi:formamidopyrimidine-DNA glycosylase
LAAPVGRGSGRAPCRRAPSKPPGCYDDAVPELPDIELYLHALTPRIVGRRVNAIRIASPFLLRTATPPIAELEGRRVDQLSRLGKRIVLHLEGRFLVLHLMVAGRLRWLAEGAPIPKKVGLAALDVEGGALAITEAGTTRRASLHVAADHAALSAMDPGGLEVLGSNPADFHTRLVSERHTLKRALTDPSLFSGIGNAYSDEILHRARLSPLRLTDALTNDEIDRLSAAAVHVLTHWRDALIRDVGDGFPEKVTAFRPGMAAHGRYNQPCPVCGTPIQRLRYAANEANYCPACQTGGRLLADRALSRLLGSDWPRSLDELERMKASRR